MISLRNSFWIFSQTLIFHHVWEIFKVMKFTFLENALLRGIFTHASPLSKLALKFLSSRPRQTEAPCLIPTGSILSKFCFSHQQTGVEEIMICYIKIQSENMRMTWNIRFLIFSLICNFFIFDGFTVLQIISII